MRSLDCSETLDLLYYALDGPIASRRHAALEEHRRTCCACVKTLMKAERMHGLLHDMRQLHMPAELEDRIIRSILA